MNFSEAADILEMLYTNIPNPHPKTVKAFKKAIELLRKESDKCSNAIVVKPEELIFLEEKVDE